MITKSKVVIGPDEYRVADETIAALANCRHLFFRGETLVRVRTPHRVHSAGVATPEPLKIVDVSREGLRELITKYVDLRERPSTGELRRVNPPGWLVAAVLRRGKWRGLRYLTAVSDSPLLRADGTILQKRGYDPATGVYFRPDREFPDIPPKPSLEMARSAAEALLEVVSDFCFSSPEHRAAWLAAVLTPSARFAFDGPTPLFLIDANIKGAGKSLLAQSIGRISLGSELPVSSYTQGVDETRKAITSSACAGERIVLLDNLSGRLGNAALDRALTSTRWRDRRLGSNHQLELPLYQTWIATGNNVVVVGDTIRRIIHIRLDVLEERPEERGGFTHDDLLVWIAAERPRLLAAALTVLAAYSAAGRPRQALTPFGSFEAWSDLVRQAVVWVGLPDPCLTRRGLRDDGDTARDAQHQLFRAWAKYDATDKGLVVAKLLPRLYAQPRPQDDLSNAMRSALECLTGSAAGRAPSVRRVANRLRVIRGQVINGKYLDRKRQERSRDGERWHLRSVGRSS